MLDPLRHYNNGDAGAVCFRRTSKQVRAEGGLWDTSEKIFPLLGAKPKESILSWDFPSGFTFTFSHIEHEKNKYDWQGSQIPVLLFDELTHFTESQFWYLVTRNRSTCGIRPYVRATTNPKKNSWVRRFIDWYIDDNGFVDPKKAGKIRYFVRFDDRIHWANSRKELAKKFPEMKDDIKSFTFIPAKLSDNKILMKRDPQYRANLLAQDKVTREQLLNGNWDIEPSSGEYFRKRFFEIVEAHPKLLRVVRCWDRAATEHKDGDPGDPDWTVGLKLGVDKDGIYYILDIERVRLSAAKVEKLIRNTALQDGVKVTVKGFQDPGGAGKNEIENFIRMLSGFDVTYDKIATDKITSAKPVSAQSEAGNVKILKSCRYIDDFLDEAENFPEGPHDDMIDALSGAFNEIALGTAGSWGDSEDDFEYENDYDDSIYDDDDNLEW